jgi:hypothetical protein
VAAVVAARRICHRIHCRFLVSRCSSLARLIHDGMFVRLASGVS